MLLLLSTIALAADYDISITPVRDKITLEQQAQFLITIRSNSTKIEKFSIYTPEVEWIIPPDTIKVYPGQSESFKLTIDPTRYILPGTYGVKVNFRREDPEELVEKTLLVNVQPESEIVSTYKPSVKTDVDMPISITPDKKLVLRVNVENQNILNLTDLAIKIDSDLDVLNTQRDIQLAPLEEKIIEFTYELNKLQVPGEIRVNFDLLKQNRTVETISTRMLTVLEVKPPFKKQEEEKLGFLKLTKELTYISESNVPDMQRISIPVGFIERLFTSAIPQESYVKIDGQRHISWDIELEPGESKTIFVTVNYRSLFYVLFLAVLITVLYFLYKSPVSIKKEVSDVSMKEGGISQIRIMLEVVNSSKKSVSNVIITDYISNIADVEQGHIEGTLKPSKVLFHKDRGTILKWELPELAPGEDRLVSYTIKSKLSIIGSFRLPRAKVAFKHKKKGYISYSNTLGVSP